MEQYAARLQKKMRKGFTTGTCAAAAAQAAVLELMLQIRKEEVSVQLPSGDSLIIPVNRDEAYHDALKHRPKLNWILEQKADAVSCYVVKDSGDDPDVTNRTRIYVTAVRVKQNQLDDAHLAANGLFQSKAVPQLFLCGGYGIGTVTKPGLEQNVGYPAINQTPRDMIFAAAETVLGMTDTVSFPEGEDGIVLIVSAPEGEVLAKKTFNPQLGIEGGISILGTSGIVEPMSEAALVATIEIETKQVLSQGRSHLLYVPGNYGERYVQKELQLQYRAIQCSNFIGETIDLAVTYGASSLLLVGNFGKLVKLAGGIMNTHSRTADCRWELVGVHAALCGADPSVIRQIREAVTTDEMLKILSQADPSQKLRQEVIASLLREADRHLKRRAGAMAIGAVMYSEAHGYLGQTEEAEEILNAIRSECEHAR